jgi:hypothetical protein
MTKGKQVVEFSFNWLLHLFTCGKLFNTPKNRLITKGFFQSFQDLDIFIILDKLQEIEKLKKI